MTEDFEQLYNKHVKQVYNLALQYVQNTSDAEEIAQDVFIAVHQQLHNFKSDSTLSTWIYRIAVNKSLDFLKAKKRKKRFGFFTAFSVSNEPVCFEHPGVLMEYEEETKQLFQYINGLPDNQKTALILQKIEGKTISETAEIMVLSPKAVESLVQRAKTNLQKKLNQAKDDEQNIV